MNAGYESTWHLKRIPRNSRHKKSGILNVWIQLVKISRMSPKGIWFRPSSIQKLDMSLKPDGGEHSKHEGDHNETYLTDKETIAWNIKVATRTTDEMDEIRLVSWDFFSRHRLLMVRFSNSFRIKNEDSTVTKEENMAQLIEDRLFWNQIIVQHWNKFSQLFKSFQNWNKWPRLE